MTEEVAALNVRLEATVAKFERDLGRATRRLQRETRTMDKSLQRTEFNARNLSRALGTAAGVLGSFATAAVVRQVEAIARRLDEIGKTADKLGLTTDALQELRAAAEDSGIGARTASVALQRFTRRVAEARSGTGEAKAALEELGISFRGANGEAKSSEELLNDVADAMSRIEDPADRVRLAFKLFDSEGVNFVNLLREGSEGLERLRKSARDTGQVVDESLIRQSEEAVTQLGRLDRKIDADLARTLANLQPLLVAFKEGLAEATGFAADLVEELNRVNDVELFIANAPAARAERQALREWEQLVARREALADRIANGGDNANNRLALADLDRQIAITRPGRDGPSTRRGPRGSRETTPETVATDPGGPRRPSRSGRSASRPIDTFAPAVQSTQERINRLELERDALGQTAAEAARAAIEFETAALKRDLLTRAMETGSGVTDQEAEVIDGLVGEFEQLSLAIAATEENQQRLAKAQREADQAAERSARSIEQLGNRFASAVQSADNLQDALRNVG
ncbi:MAG: phage tail tape measure protein [Pseudomonadota bacterium]